MGWVTYGSYRLILVGLGNLRFLQVNPSGLRILVGLCNLQFLQVNRITANGAYMRHRFLRASFKLNDFLNFRPFATLNSSNVANVFNLTSYVRVRVRASCAKDVSRGSLVSLKI